MNIFHLLLSFFIPLTCLAEDLVFSNQSSAPYLQSNKVLLLARNINTSIQINTSSIETVRSGRIPVRKTGSIKPQYEHCKGKDIYKLNSELQDTSPLTETEAKGPCIDCAFASDSNGGSQNDIQQVLQTKVESEKGNKIRSRLGTTIETGSKKTRSPYQAFKDQLIRRVLGQVRTKLAQTQILQKCIEKENTEKKRAWLTKRFPKVDWPLMKALCEKKKKDFHSSIKQRWPDMRVSLALASANPDQVVTSRPNLSFSLIHEVSDFGSMSKLTKEEQRLAKERWAEHLSKAPLDNLSSEQLKTQFTGVTALQQASTKDLQEMRRATWDLNEKSRDRYRQIIDEMPLLGYMKTGDPDNREDMNQAFSKYLGHLNDLLEKVEDKNVNMSLLLSFEPLVEGLLEDNEGYCLAAEGARLKAERDESLKKWSLVAAGVVAAVPCFMAGPVGAAFCFGAGALVGATGYIAAKGRTKKGLERYLTGGDFETLASLSEKDSEAFWELMLLPTAAWGTTAGTIQAAKGLLKKGATASKVKGSNNIYIQKIGNSTSAQEEIFKIKLKSPQDDNEVQFNLKIPSELLKDENLLSDIQIIVSQMSRESFTGIDQMTYDQFYSMASSQYMDRVFKNIMHTYGKHRNAGRTKLSSIGPENIHIREKGGREYRNSKHYDIQFEDQKGNKMSIDLVIANILHNTEADIFIFPEDLKSFKQGDKKYRYLLSVQQKIQIAIGQMPAELLKGLKSISVHSFDERGVFLGGSGAHVRGQKELVADGCNRSTIVTSSEMVLSSCSLGRLFYKNSFKFNGGLIETIAHELGHVLANARFGSSHPGEAWMSAINKDGSSVSEYGDTKPEEDFAEAIRVYIHTDGGTKNPKAMEDFTHRFEILDNLMQGSMQ